MVAFVFFFFQYLTVAVEWKLVELIIICFWICCGKIVYSWWQSAATDGVCEQNTLTRHIFSCLHACWTVSHVTLAQDRCPHHVIRVSCACVSDLSSTLHSALFTVSLSSSTSSSWSSTPPSMWVGSERKNSLCPSANEESDSLVNNAPLTSKERTLPEEQNMVHQRWWKFFKAKDMLHKAKKNWTTILARWKAEERYRSSLKEHGGTNSICVVALELPRLVAPDVPTISHTEKKCFCSWFQVHHVGAQYSVLSPVTAFFVWQCSWWGKAGSQSQLTKKRRALFFRNVPANTVSSTEKKVDAGRVRFIESALRGPHQLKLSTFFHSGGATTLIFIVKGHDLVCKEPSVRNQRTLEFPFENSKCADTGTNDSGILQRSEACSLCTLLQYKMDLFHMKPRVSLKATVLTKGKILPEGSANHEISHQANESGMLPFGAGIFHFKKLKNILTVIII